MRKIRPILLLCLIAICPAADIVIEGQALSYVNPDWDLMGTELIVKDAKPYIRINTRGNCRWESRQVCHPNGHGGVTCRTEHEWVCDYDSGLFSLPESIVATEGEVRYQENNQSLKIGVQRAFLFWKWVKLENYVGLFSDIVSARLIIRDPSEVNQEIRFDLLQGLEASDK